MMSPRHATTRECVCQKGVSLIHDLGCCRGLLSTAAPASQACAWHGARGVVCPGVRRTRVELSKSETSLRDGAIFSLSGRFLSIKHPHLLVAQHHLHRVPVVVVVVVVIVVVVVACLSAS